MYWEVFMTIVFFLSLFFIPAEIILNFHNQKPFQDFLAILAVILDFCCIVDLTISFLTGYLDQQTREVVLKKPKAMR